MSAVPKLRIRKLGDAPVRDGGAYVVYWMVATRRLRYNHALDRAIEHCRALHRPLVILEPLNVDYRWASDRHHAVVLDGMAEHRTALANAPVTYHAWVESEPGEGRGLLATLLERACVVVTDDAPVFHTPQLLASLERITPCRAEAVDSCGLLPLAAPGRSFSAAYHFRRYLHRELLPCLGDSAVPDPIEGLDLPRLEALPDDFARRWPETPLEGSGAAGFGRDLIAGLPIDHSVGATGWRGGYAAARQRLDRFLTDRLAEYTERNHPDAEVVSGLSPALHYGHIASREIFEALVEHEGWSPARISPPHDGRRSGWWGMSEPAEAFVDQLVTWRELGFGYAYWEPDFRDYDTLPEWARETLETHAADPRPWTYTREEFERAGTHDELWNAAQRQLLEEGVIHNYLRMLWGKKILEWSAHPREAFETMIELNNRWGIDGRDPNSWSGITWVMGRFDRGWPERAVFGKVRSMTSDSTRRKVRLDRYLGRWGDQPELV